MLRHSIWLLVFALVLVGCDRQPAPIVEHSPQLTVKPKHLYKVRTGDTLYSIAFIANSDVYDLARLNNLSEPFTIYVGQILALHPSAAEAARNQSPAKQTNQKPVVQPPKAHNKTKVAATPPRATPMPKPNRENAKSDKGWVWPAQGKIITQYSSGSKGIDITGKSGTAIKASRSGVVVYTGNAIRGSGNMIIIKHNERYLTAYAHLKKIGVKEGQQVRQAEIIGTMGNTDTTSDRLHFEVRDKGKPVNPLNFLKS